MSAAFSALRFRQQLQTHWLGQGFVYEPVVGSTMDLARSLAHDGAPNGTVVLAEEQTLGRGRMGRHWLSPYGVNLYLSILLRPSLAQLQTLSIVTPLAVLDGLRTAADIDCSIKWPNDIQAGGRKLAGILLESELSGSQPLFAIVGAGINVNYDTTNEPEIAAIATSMLRESGSVHERERVLARCLEAFERCYEEPASAVWGRWRDCLNTIGQEVRVTFQGQIEEGVAEDVSEDGSLILRRRDGTCLSLPAGEVSLRV